MKDMSERAGEPWNESSNAQSPISAQSRSMFQQLFESSADAMSLFDPQTGAFIELNAAVARQIGAPSIEALKFITPAQVSPERQPDGSLSADKAAEMIRLTLQQGSHRF